MYEISADPARLDVARVHQWLSADSYWAKGRSLDKQRAAIANSLNFGAYREDTGEQHAYARVVTDLTTFAWLCDVYVDPQHRGAGLGEALVRHVVRELEGLDLRRWMLRTDDAHALYARFGFTELEDLGTWMARELPGGGIR
jgi:GNAT superfamily N-acetyltransferase